MVVNVHAFWFGKFAATSAMDSRHTPLMHGMQDVASFECQALDDLSNVLAKCARAETSGPF